MDDHGPTLTLDEIGAATPVQLARFDPALLTIACNTDDATLLAQTRHNLSRGLPEMVNTLDFPAEKRTLSLCGSGPSLLDTIPELTGKVMACNAAILALAARGRRPDYAMIWDATPEMTRYVVDLSPQTSWMIASRVHPQVIDALLALGQQVTLWHRATTDPAMAALYGRRPVVFGGATAITTGPFLCGAMGFEDLHVFGADSSFPEIGASHVGGPLREEHEISVLHEGRIFRTTQWMLNQAESWLTFVLPELEPQGMRFTVHGDGLLPHAHRMHKAKVAAEVTA